jgi:Protein of unknown function (DUF2934)
LPIPPSALIRLKIKIQTVLRKKIKTQNRNDAAGESTAPAPEPKVEKVATRRISTAAKKSKPTGKKDTAARKTKSRSGAQTAQTIAPTDEEIRLRAYLISERRHRLALPGDASADWLEAKRQLLSELGRR